jgi:hypothetical protein
MESRVQELLKTFIVVVPSFSIQVVLVRKEIVFCQMSPPRFHQKMMQFITVEAECDASLPVAVVVAPSSLIQVLVVVNRRGVWQYFESVAVPPKLDEVRCS